jgi:hypothetical protein
MFQNRAARIIAGASYEIRSANVPRTLDWENLETGWCLTKATFLYKVWSNSAAPTLKDSFISIGIFYFYYIHFEINGVSSNLIGSQECDFSTNRIAIGVRFVLKSPSCEPIRLLETPLVSK